MRACYHTAMAELVWYVAYGSNLGAARLQRYLDRGPDPTPPRADRSLTIGHPLFFAGESTVWGGGRAYVDHEPDAGRATLARAWLLTSEQWADLHRQESGPDDDRYPTLVDLGRHDGVAVRTFTGPDRLDPDRCTRPAPTYLQAIATGLAEAHGLAIGEVVDYLFTCPGLADCWTRDDLHTALTV